MRVLKVIKEFRPENMAMYYGTREEFKIQLPKDSPIVLEVKKLINVKLNEDLETELLLLENTDVDRNLYSFLRTLDVLEEGMSILTHWEEDHPVRELVENDAMWDVITRFRLIRFPMKGYEVYAITPLSLSLQHGVNYYDLDVLQKYIPEIVFLLDSHGFAEEIELKK